MGVEVIAPLRKLTEGSNNTSGVSVLFRRSGVEGGDRSKNPLRNRIKSVRCLIEAGIESAAGANDHSPGQNRIEVGASSDWGTEPGE